VLVLPRAIVVQVVAEGEATPGDLLVGLSLRYQGRDYFNTLVGLTGTDGAAELLGATLLADFRDSQRLFPMDYRVPLAECDPTAGIAVLGGDAFLRQRAAGQGIGYIPPAVHAQWARARNATVASTRIDLALDQPDAAGVVRGVLTVTPAPRAQA
jgi:hypothetical protein